MKRLGTGRLYYYLLHVIVLYSFFTRLYQDNKLNSLRNYSSYIEYISYKKISLDPISSIEKKFLVDLSYKNQFYSKNLKFSFKGLFYLDKEGKILGCRDVTKDYLHTFNIYQGVNKTFLHSTLFGSIKCIKI